MLVFATKRGEVPVSRHALIHDGRGGPGLRSAVVAEIEVERLSVKISGLGTVYTMAGAEHGQVSLTIDPRQSRPATRLCQALALMSPAGGKEGDAPGPGAREQPGAVMTRTSRSRDLHIPARGAHASLPPIG